MLTVALAALRTRWTTLIGTFVALALGVGLIATMGLGLASTFDAPGREPQRLAASRVVVLGNDTLTVPVRRGPSTAQVAQRLAHPHPVDIKLLSELRALGPVTLDGRTAGSGGPDAVGVDAPVADVRRVVGDRAQVLTGDARRRADPATERDAEALLTVNALLGTAGGITAFVSVFVVASTFAFAVALRRREFGLLRTAGATPGQLRRLLLTEAAVVGTLASAAGCALGHWAAPHLAHLLADGEVAPSWFTIRPAAWPLHAAFWTGPAVALTGVWAASRRAGRTGPSEALREADVDTGVLPPVRRLLGFALLAGAVFLMTKSLVTDASGLLKRKTYTTQPMVLITAVALLAPLLVRPLTRLLPLPGATGMLVRANTAASLRRTAAVAAPVLITVALAGSVLGSAMTVSQAKAAEAREHTRADLVVTGEDLKLRPTPGAELSASASTAVFVRDEGTALIRSQARAVDAAKTLAAVEQLPVVAGDLRDLDDRSIVVNEEWEQHTVGATVRVWLGDGRPVSLRIAAVLAIGTGNNGAYVTAANAPTAPVDRIDVRLAPGADRAAVAAALRDTGGEGAVDGSVAGRDSSAYQPADAARPDRGAGHRARVHGAHARQHHADGRVRTVRGAERTAAGRGHPAAGARGRRRGDAVRRRTRRGARRGRDRGESGRTRRRARHAVRAGHGGRPVARGGGCGRGVCGGRGSGGPGAEGRSARVNLRSGWR